MEKVGTSFGSVQGCAIDGVGESVGYGLGVGSIRGVVGCFEHKTY